MRNGCPARVLHQTMSDSDNSSISSDEDKKAPLLDDSAEVDDDEDEDGGEVQEADNKSGGKAKKGEEDAEEEDGDNNEYERDGFVVSDDEGDESDDSDDRHIVKRKRKRLKKKTAVLDDDDLQLIRDNLEDQAGFVDADEDDRSFLEGSDAKRQRSLQHVPGSHGQAHADAQSVDSDGMDEFIVDDHQHKRFGDVSPRKRSHKKADVELSEEQNSEFLELFGYNKEDFETTEIAPESKSTTPSPKKRISRLKSRYHYEELARQYLLEEDKEIALLDVPERMQFKERRLGLKRDAHNRGEFFLRFNLSIIESQADLVEEVEKQRLKQAEWVYQRLLEKFLSRVAKESAQDALENHFFTFEAVKTPLLYVLYAMQVEMMEPGFLFTYRNAQIGKLSLPNLHDIHAFMYDYVAFVQKRDTLLDFIEKVVPDDVEDESVMLNLGSRVGVVPDATIIEAMNQVTRKGVSLSEEQKTGVDSFLSSLVPDVAEQVQVWKFESENSWKSALRKQLLDLPAKYDISYLNEMHKYIKFRFGSAVKPQKTSSALENPRKEVDDLFGDDDSADGNEMGGKLNSSQRRRRKSRTTNRAAKLGSKEFNWLCKSVVSVPFLGKRLMAFFKEDNTDEETEKLSLYVDDFVAKQPFYLATKIIQDERNKLLYSDDVDLVFQSVVASLAKEIMLDSNVINYLKVVCETYGGISTVPGPNFELILPDFGNDYVKVVGLTNKPFRYFTTKQEAGEDYEDMFSEDEPKHFDFRSDFLLICRAEREGILKLEISTFDVLVDAVRADFCTVMLSAQGTDVVQLLKEKNQNVTPELLEENGLFWDALRLRLIEYCLERQVKPWLEKNVRTELRKKAEAYVAGEAYYRMLERFCVSSVKLPLSSLPEDFYIPPSLNVSPTKGHLVVLSLFLSEERYDFEALQVQENRRQHDISCASVVDSKGKEVAKTDLPSLMEMDKLKRLIRDLITEYAPHFVVLNGGQGLKTKHLLEESRKFGTTKIFCG